MRKNKEEFIKAKGHVFYELRDSKGRLKKKWDVDNLVVTVGKNYLAAWLAAASQSDEFMSYVGLGTGTNAASASDTALQTEFSGGGYSRIQGTLTSSTNVWQNVASFPAGNGTGAITEAGLFSASTSGTMFARQVFSAVNKASGDTLQVTWQVTFS